MSHTSVSLWHMGCAEAVSRIVRSGRFASWAGQGIVSATNFGILILVARGAGVEQLGYYALGFSIMVMAMAAQDALVTKPYAVQLFKPPGGPEAHAYGALVSGILFSVAVAAALALGAWALAALTGDGGLTRVLFALAAMLPFMLLRDFARRFSFANLHMGRALATDAVACALVLGLTGALALAGQLDAASAMLALGISGAATGAAWLFLARRSFVRSPGIIAATARQSWSIGKWLLSSQLTLQLQGYAAHWIILVQAGAAVTGLYSALLSVVALANPFLFGLINMLMPRYVRARHAGGDRALRREAYRDAALIAGIMGGFALVLYLAGAIFLGFLFPGGNISEAAPVLAVLALTSALSAVAAPATIAMTAAERGRAIAGLSLAACLLNSLAVLLLLPAFGLMGAAWGMLTADAAGTLARWFLFLRATRASGPETRGINTASVS